MSQPAVTGPAKTMRWNDELDRDLLLAILSQIPGHDVFRLIDMEKIAQKLGPTCSVRAIEERLKKLKKNANARMDETAPHVLGGTRRMEAEFRARRSAEITIVQRRGPRAKAKTRTLGPEGGSKTASKKPRTRASAATTAHSRNKKGTARIIKKGKAKATEETSTEDEAGEASNVVEDFVVDETLQTGEALNAGTTHDNSHKCNEHQHQKETMSTDTPEPLKPTPKKRQRAPVSVIELDSGDESSASPPIKKRKREKDKSKDHPPKSTTIKRESKHSNEFASREGED